MNENSSGEPMTAIEMFILLSVACAFFCLYFQAWYYLMAVVEIAGLVYVMRSNYWKHNVFDSRPIMCHRPYCSCNLRHWIEV